ncbi:hypothetical protein HY483_00660 [Candidatus Woesearchaeota archaeon]|nr:hypothetical protein [Candidatus Woesearchaeota archaeon]
MKKIVLISVMLLVVVVILAGCGSKTNAIQGSQATAESSTTPQKVVQNKTTPEIPEPTTISIIVEE